MNLPQLRPRQWLALCLGIISFFALALLFMNGDTPFRLPLTGDPRLIISTGTVKPGDILATVLKTNGIQNRYIPPVEKALGKVYDLRTIRPGHTYEIVRSTDGVLDKFIYRIDAVHAFVVSRSSGNSYGVEKNDDKTVWIEKRVAGQVHESLYRDLLKLGYDEPFVANLVGDLADNIFAWRIDFFTEQRPGDQFEILMEQEYKIGTTTPIRNGRGRILAARYSGKATKTKENIAIRFTPPNQKRPDYYDLEGNAVRRAFLRAPFTHGAFRISSGFTFKRFHPILRTYRPHHGTDYAAATGTPVAAIGRGTVIRAEVYKGYGNCIDIQHSSKYVSRYGHLSKILVRRGTTVGQGQTIGRVGSTGLSTGPHLHFEMLVDGAQRNFITMSFPAASALANADKPDFNRVKDEVLQRLNVETAAVTN